MGSIAEHGDDLGRPPCWVVKGAILLGIAMSDVLIPHRNAQIIHVIRNTNIMTIRTTITYFCSVPFGANLVFVAVALWPWQRPMAKESLMTNLALRPKKQIKKNEATSKLRGRRRSSAGQVLLGLPKPWLGLL